MTTPPSDDAVEATAAASSRKTWIVVGAVIAAGLAVLVYLNWKPWIQWPMWVNGADKREYWDKIAAEQDPDIIPTILKGFRDPEKGDDTRIALGNLLIDKKNRLGEVESALKDPDFEARRIALLVLSPKDYFHRQYVADADFGVEKTLLAWIADKGAKARARAIREVVPRVWPPPSTSPAALRALSDLVAAEGAGELPEIRGLAAQTVLAYRDCESAARVLAAAAAETNPLAKHDEMQAIVQVYDATGGAGGTCAKELPEDAVRSLVEGAFRHAGTGSYDTSLRLLAIGYLGGHAAWGNAHLEELRTIVALPPGGGNDVDRRTALDSLFALHDDTTLKQAAKYFHDPYAGIRSSAVQNVVHGSGGLEAKDFTSSLVGFVRREPAGAKNQAWAFRTALQKLRMFGGSWLGFPPAAKDKGAAVEAETERIAVAIFQRKADSGTTREKVAEAWWDWLAGENGIKDRGDVDAARRARDAFWAKADTGDVAGAKAVLEAAPAKEKPLWGYERGWLLSKS